MDKLKNTKILGIVGAIFLIIGNFFTFAKLEFFGTHTGKLIDGSDGVIVLILGILALLIVFIDFILTKVPEGKMQFLFKLRNPKAVLIPAVIAGIIVVVKAFDEVFEVATRGLGCWILLLGVAALVAHAFIYKGDNE